MSRIESSTSKLEGKYLIRLAIKHLLKRLSISRYFFLSFQSLKIIYEVEIIEIFTIKIKVKYIIDYYCASTNYTKQ